MVFVIVIAYVLIAALSVFLLIVFATKFADYSMDFYFEPWPILAGVFWPVGAPIAAAYIAAKWFIDRME